MLDAYEATFDGTEDALDRSYLRVMRHLHAMDRGGVIDPADASRAAQELVTLGRAAQDASATATGLLVMADCAAILGLCRDAAADCDEVCAIGSTAQSRLARETQGADRLYGGGSLSAYRAFAREQERIGSSDRRKLAELVHDAMFAAASRAPDAPGRLERASARAEELYAANQLPFLDFDMLFNGFVLARDRDAAIRYAQRLSGEFRRTGAWAYLEHHLGRGHSQARAGRLGRAVLPLVEEAEGYTSPYDAVAMASLGACQAILTVRAGDHGRAVELTDETLRSVDRTQQTWLRADLRRLLSEVPRAVGDSDRERRWLLEAQEMYHRKEIVSYDPEIDRRLAKLGGEKV